jgi:acyl carrier protein
MSSDDANGLASQPSPGKGEGAANAIPWDADSVAEKIKGIVDKKAYAPVTLDSTFDSLGLDSLAMAEIVFEVESTFNIRTNERILDLQNLREVVDYVVQEIEKRKTPKG